MRGTSSWRSRRVGGLLVTDVALAASLTLIGLVSAFVRQPPEGPRWITLPVAAVMCGALAWRRRLPVVTALVVAAASTAQAAVSVSPGALWAFAALLVAMYSVAAHADEVWAAVGGGALLAALFAQEWLDAGADYVFIVLVFGGTWLLGRGVRGWKHRAISAEAANDEASRLAVMEERLRLARELHDVVAHALGVIAVQSEAAQAYLDRDPTQARASLATVRDSARTALAEMRDLLGVLRTDDEANARPLPRLAELPDLVDGFRRAGLTVSLRVSHVADDLRPGVALALYRLVEEALTNALKHAGRVRVRVVVSAGDGVVGVEVTNQPGVPGRGLDGAAPAASGSHLGLVGLRERVAALGGTLSFGPTVEGGFRVGAVLPLDAEGAVVHHPAGAAP